MTCCNTAPYKRLQRVLCRPCSYTVHSTKQRIGLYSGFSCDLTNSTAHDTRPTQAAIIPPALRWSVSQRRSTSSTYQIPAPPRTLHRSAQPTYYNNVYKGAPGAPAEGSASPPVQVQPGGLQSGTGSAVRAHRLAPYTRRGSPAAGARRAARNH